jgi:hypothetical protein
MSDGGFRPLHFVWCCSFLLLVIAPAPGARARQLASTELGRPVVEAVRLTSTEEITLDGQLDESVWERTAAATDFRQLDPQNGEPATEPTEIRVVFSEDTLYIGAEFFDSNPEGILANQMVRDGSLGSDDRLMWVLDPQDDQRSGYFFEVNPAGAMGDAQLIPATSGTFGTSQNRAWDGIWMARVRQHEAGWTIEVAIPFSTLNFNPRAEAWGANFQRTIRRKNEEVFWSGWGRNEGLLVLTAAGRIEGISGISQGRGLDLQPYVIGTYSEQVTPPMAADWDQDVGLDVFYKLTPQLQANLTVNTDFAQTEVDDRQVNLTRFPLFFPEKRDFFLEGAGDFDFTREPARTISAFFSRRIGLTDGRPQKIDYGAKVVGQIAGFNLGLMHVRTAEQGGTAAQPVAVGEDFTVIRPKRQFFRQSYAGLIYTRRAARDGTTPDRHTIGVDFQLATAQFRGNKNLQFNAYYAKTPNGDGESDNASYGLRLVFANEPLSSRIWFVAVDENFDPAVGFVQRRNYKHVQPVMTYFPRPANHPWIRAMRIQVWAALITDGSGQWAERNYPINFNMDFHSGDRITANITRTSYERLQRDFRITPDVSLPEGNVYAYTRYRVGFETATRRAVSGEASLTVGSFYSGTRRDVELGLNLRPRRGIVATFGSSFNRVELDEGSFSTKVLRSVVDTQFSPFVSVSNNVQYDTVSRVLGWQLRFRWILEPGNDIYVVWVNNWLDTGETLQTMDRSAAAKLVYTHRF